MTLPKSNLCFFKENFVTTSFGLPAIREYPKGVEGTGDIDSGPVIFGVGFTATIMGLGLGSLFDDPAWAESQYQTVHAFGFVRQNEKRKKYLWGALPMADAFIAWGLASELNHSNANVDSGARPTYWKFHFISLLFITIFFLLHYRKKVIKRIRRKAVA